MLCWRTILPRRRLNLNKLPPSATIPALENEFVLEISQPLLRDFGNDINRARIVINRNNQVISLLEFRKQIEETVARHRKDLLGPDAMPSRIVKIQEDEVSQHRSIRRWICIKRRGPGGDVSRLQISQTEAQIDIRRSQLIRAKCAGQGFVRPDQARHERSGLRRERADHYPSRYAARRRDQFILIRRT